MLTFLVRAMFLPLMLLTVQRAATQDVGALLDHLTPAQKVKTLEYLRGIGSDIDQQILCAYEQLGPEVQQQAYKYLKAIQPQNSEKAPRTTVEWSRDTIYFGSLEEGTTLLDSVVITNTGTAPYYISGVQTACDCKVLQAPDYPILPGEKATVRIELNTSSKRGKIKSGIVIQDNSAPNARSIIYLRGAVTPSKKAKKRPWE